VMEVRATAGDVALGGDDFTALLAGLIAGDQGVSRRGGR
jgi:molecular chaperone HscC